MNKSKTRVIYGDSPFIEDMGVLTTLCLLNDEVVLFGSKTLAEHLDDHWETRGDENISSTQSVAEQMLEVLLPEGVVSFYAPSDLETAFPGSGSIEIPGLSIEMEKDNGKEKLVIRSDRNAMTDFSRALLNGITTSSHRTVSTMLRDIAVISASLKEGIPIISSQAQVSLEPSRSRVSEVSAFLAQRTFQRLVMPDLQAYHADDILEARNNLKSELLEFKAGILDLVWLLHQKTDINGDLIGVGRECDILIDTKITSAVMQLEKAIASHESNKVRRILKASGGALLELGKSFLSPSLAGTLLGAGGAAMKLSDGLDSKQPSIQIASFVYKVRNKRF